MNGRDNNEEAFFALLRAGLWEKDVRLSAFKEIDFETVYQMAEYQTVDGLIAAGLDHVADVKVPTEIVLTFVGSALQLEQINKSMNVYLKKLIQELRSADIYTLLVKGQGIAQCYERPLWRTSGDIDLLLSKDNYLSAKKRLEPLASEIAAEEAYKMHLGLTIDSWEVELHGNLHSELSSRVERVIDDVYNDIFYGGNVRSWDNGGTSIFLPSADNDVIIVFVHILQHYFHGGIGLSQICDWCRLLWTFRDSLNHGLLESRIKKAGIISEWKAFAAFAVGYLGMPVEAMPLFDENDNHNERFKKKAEKIKDFILLSGNFGHRDLSYVKTSTYIGRKMHSLWNSVKGMFQHVETFPMDSFRFFLYYMYVRIYALGRGE